MLTAILFVPFHLSWFGFNGNVLALGGDGVNAGSCVNGTDTSPFGQFSYCNAPAFFTAANAAIKQGKLTVPPIGKATDGQSCMTTRDFGLVDQDQSDNVTTTYLALPDGRTAPNTQAANRKLAGKNAGVMANGSDNLLLDHFVDPALGCTPWTAPDLANPGFQATNLGLNELQAAADQQAPVAVVPANDPMVLDGNGAESDTKTDLYRAGVDQAPLSQVSGSPRQYCADLRTIGVTRTKLDRNLTNTTSSPDTGAASNLFTFLAMRLQQSYVNLGCEQALGKGNPVHLKMDGNNIVVDATFDHVGPVPTPSPSASASASPSPSLSPSAVTSPSPSAPVKPSTAPPSPSAPANPSTAPAGAPSKSPVATTPPPPPPAPSTPAAPSSTQGVGGNDHSNHTPGAVISPSAPPAGGPGAPNQPPKPAAGKSTNAAAPGGTTGGGSGTAGGSNGAGAPAGNAPGSGAAAGTNPNQAVTSTPISVAGFERAHAAANNPNSALSGPDPMANSGFSIMSSRVFWALGGALLVLGLSMLYRRRPQQRRQSRRGVSS